MIEWFQSIGALGALANLFDRFAKGRPTASFTVKDKGTRKLGCIRIKNKGDYDIAIKDVCVKPEVYFLTEDMKVGTLLRSQRKRPTFTLRPQEEKELIIARRYTDDGSTARDLEDQNVTFSISWRRCNRMSLPRIPMYVQMSTSTIRQYADP